MVSVGSPFRVLDIWWVVTTPKKARLRTECMLFICTIGLQ